MVTDPFPNLRLYVSTKNVWLRLMDEPQMVTGRLTPAQAESLFQSLDGDMSPENLHCDGEISAEQARAKAAFYKVVHAELLSQGWTPNGRLYCIDHW